MVKTIKEKIVLKPGSIVYVSSALSLSLSGDVRWPLKQNAPPQWLEMTDAEGAAPAAKLHKAADGDVTGSLKGEMQAVTPQLQTVEDKAHQAESGNIVSPSKTAIAASQNDGGKKRKVALYVAYIGAGYHVSAPASTIVIKLPGTVQKKLKPSTALQRLLLLQTWLSEALPSCFCRACRGTPGTQA